MSISSLTERTKATGSDSTATYNYNFRVFDKSHLLVTVRNLTTFQETTLVLTTDYTVSGVGQASGSITLVNAGQAWLDQPSGNLSSNFIIIIRRVVPLQQSTSIRNQGNYYASVHEDTFDYMTMALQQLYDYIQRAVILPETVLATDGFNPVLPTTPFAGGVIPPNSVLQINPSSSGWALGNPLLGWQAVQIPYSSFNAAGLTQQVTAFSLPAACMLIGVMIKHSVAFGGGAISDVYCDVGTVASPDLFLKDFDVLQAVGDLVFDNTRPDTILSIANATNVMLKATAVGGNLNTLTAGQVTVYYWYMYV